jgi:hypothetical protein
VSVLVLFLWWVNWRSKKTEVQKKESANRPEPSPPAYHMVTLDRVPEYEPPNAGEAVEGGGVDRSEETPMPPEYEGHGPPGETAEARSGNEEARTEQHIGS